MSASRTIGRYDRYAAGDRAHRIDEVLSVRGCHVDLGVHAFSLEIRLLILVAIG
jgi:hypothetical protein